MDLSKPKKFGLVCLTLAFITIGFSYSLFNDAEESAKEDEFADLEAELDSLVS